MNRRIVTWVATGAVVLGIGAAGVGAVVVNSNAAAESSAPVATAPATTNTTAAASAQGSATGSSAGGLVQKVQSEDGQGQRQAAQAGAMNGGDGPTLNGGGQARGG